jgi:hypothetical protein
VTKVLSFFVIFLLCGSAPGLAQMRNQKVSTENVNSPASSWDTSLPGMWTYRSYLNRADILVNADPDPAVQALDPIYGQGNAATASSALKALNLIFGEGLMIFGQPSANNIAGTVDFGGGFVLDFDLVGTGRPGTPTDNWEYDYKATTTPKWPNGIGQIPAMVGTVIRAKPHGTAKAGVVASFIAIKQ